MPCYTKVQIEVTNEGSALDALMALDWYCHGTSRVYDKEDLRVRLKERIRAAAKAGTFTVDVENSRRGRFLQEYGVVEAQRKAKAQGYVVQRTNNPDGRVILTARRSY